GGGPPPEEGRRAAGAGSPGGMEGGRAKAGGGLRRNRACVAKEARQSEPGGPETAPAIGRPALSPFPCRRDNRANRANAPVNNRRGRVTGTTSIIGCVRPRRPTRSRRAA